MRPLLARLIAAGLLAWTVGLAALLAVAAAD